MDETREIILSKCRTGIATVVLFVILALASSVLIKDTQGEGLASTIYYPLIGELIYPVFYGTAGFVLFILSRIALSKNKSFFYYDGVLHIPGRNPFNYSDIESVNVDERTFLDRMTISLSNGRQIHLSSLFLAERLVDVKIRLEKLEQDTSSNPTV